jgi:hypothetical protein
MSGGGPAETLANDAQLWHDTAEGGRETVQWCATWNDLGTIFLVNAMHAMLRARGASL